MITSLTSHLLVVIIFWYMINQTCATYTSGFWERMNQGRSRFPLVTTAAPLPIVRAEVSPSRKCARAWCNTRAHCGGLSSGNGGTCDRHCGKNGFLFSNCFPNFCLCHTGLDYGRECTTLEMWLKHK